MYVYTKSKVGASVLFVCFYKGLNAFIRAKCKVISDTVFIFLP